MPTASYGNWRGIVYLWGYGGALEHDQEPNRFSVNFDEKQAAMLMQDGIDKSKTNIENVFKTFKD